MNIWLDTSICRISCRSRFWWLRFSKKQTNHKRTQKLRNFDLTQWIRTVFHGDFEIGGPNIKKIWHMTWSWSYCQNPIEDCDQSAATKARDASPPLTSWGALSSRHPLVWDPPHIDDAVFGSVAQLHAPGPPTHKNKRKFCKKNI